MSRILRKSADRPTPLGTYRPPSPFTESADYITLLYYIITIVD